MNMLLPEKGLVLEIGCGRGHLTTLLQAACKELVACDFSRTAIKEDRKTIDKNVSLLLCDTLNSPFRSHSFDAVVLSEVLEHVCDQHKCLDEVKRILSPSGKLILTTPSRLYACVAELILRLFRRSPQKEQIFDEPLFPSSLRRLVSTRFLIEKEFGVYYHVAFLEKLKLPWLLTLERRLSELLEEQSAFSLFGLYQCFLCFPKEKLESCRRRI
jgi:ubiquinone/menaquinone biosynthesis C-methylase UbiE